MPLSEAAQSSPHGPASRRSAAAPGQLCLLLILALTWASAARGTCEIRRLPDIAVTMEGTVPLAHAQLNGHDALFIVDSGAFFSLIAPGAVAELGLTADPRYASGEVIGIGGSESAQVMRAKTFSIMGLTVPNLEFIVAGINIHGAAGLLGQNLFRLGDVEYDLANGVIRIVRPKDCKGSPLAYWAAAADKPYSVIDIDFATPQSPYTQAAAYLNGTKISVIFDTGASRSLLTLSAAKRAGITPESPGVERGGNQHGIGRRAAQSWIARFANFKLGDEEIHQARLRFADVRLPTADMLIGADFFLSHRVYVATSQRKLYFTYNGGPVFDLKTRDADEGPETTPEAEPAAAANGAPPDNSGERPASAPAADIRLDQPTDAAGFARRGSASAARHDYAAAIADLTRACELAPGDASYPYQRGMLHWQTKQLDLALADLDQAIKLKPDEVRSLVARAGVKSARHDAAAAAADLESADRLARQDSDEHLQIASVYEAIDNPAAARAQYSKWIDTHPHSDPRRADVLNSRCWEGALAGEALNQALADCNAALRIAPKAASYLDSRGLVHLRLGSYDEAIADYDAALKINPRIVWSLYGRGLARLRKGQSAAGQADLAAAATLQPKIAERAAKFGLTP